MATTEAVHCAGEDIDNWLRRAFEAERAPRPCRYPAVIVTAQSSAATPSVQQVRVPLVRNSYVLMLALSVAGLLLGL